MGETMKQYIVSIISLFVGIGGTIGYYEFPTSVEIQVVSVYDGDTFKANIVGYPDIIGENISIRIKGIDTPEIRGGNPDTALKARAHTERRLSEGKITLGNLERDKYFRILADVYVDGEHLGNELIEQGLAREYDGGKKP